MNAGDTFKYGYGEHLWFIVSDPAFDGEHVVIANFTGFKSWQDPTCIVDVGDHPFITKKTCVYYAKSKIVTSADLETQLSCGSIILGEPLSPDLLKKIRDGAAASRRTPFPCKQVLRDQLEYP